MKRCGKYLGDNDATCPQLTCIREHGHPGLCDNVSDRPDLPSALVRYRQRCDQLREHRRAAGSPWPMGWEPETDRVFLAEMEDLYMLLSPSEIDVVESEGWRSWPDAYDKHTKGLIT